MLNSLPWLYPALEIAHIAGIALLFGGLLVFDLRAFGLAQALPVAALARLTLPLALAGFALCALTGLGMFATQPQELLVNPAFRWKLLLVMLAGLNAALYHSRSGPLKIDVMAKAQGLLSLAIWLGVIACGRSIAYV